MFPPAVRVAAVAHGCISWGNKSRTNAYRVILAEGGGAARVPRLTPALHSPYGGHTGATGAVRRLTFLSVEWSYHDSEWTRLRRSFILNMSRPPKFLASRSRRPNAGGLSLDPGSLHRA